MIPSAKSESSTLGSRTDTTSKIIMNPLSPENFLIRLRKSEKKEADVPTMVRSNVTVWNTPLAIS